jgi:hypothetical protein
MAKTTSTKPISIELNIEGKKKKITQNGITVGAMRKIMKYYKKMEEVESMDSMSQLDLIDDMIVLITEIFNDPRVDFETVENSILLDELAPVFQQIVGTAMGVSNDPKDNEKK